MDWDDGIVICIVSYIRVYFITDWSQSKMSNKTGDNLTPWGNSALIKDISEVK